MRKNQTGQDGGVTSSAPKSKVKFKKKYVLILVLILVLAGLVLTSVAAWLYSAPLTKTKQSVFESVRLPLARVGYVPISSHDVTEQVKASKLLGKPIEFKEALVLAIQDQKLLQVHEKLIGGKKSNFVSKLEQLIETTDAKNIPSSYKSMLVEPYAALSELQLKYVSDEKRHVTQYAKAKAMVDSLLKNVEFKQAAISAGIWKDGDISAVFSGDQGYIAFEKLSPEVQIALDRETPGVTKIVATRLGVTVIHYYDKIETEENKVQVGVRSAVLPVSGFDAWLDQQYQGVNTKMYLKSVK